MDGDRWRSNFNWLDNDWNDNNPAAVDATLFISHSASAGLKKRYLTPTMDTYNDTYNMTPTMHVVRRLSTQPVVVSVIAIGKGDKV